MLSLTWVSQRKSFLNFVLNESNIILSELFYTRHNWCSFSELWWEPAATQLSGCRVCPALVPALNGSSEQTCGRRTQVPFVGWMLLLPDRAGRLTTPFLGFLLYVGVRGWWVGCHCSWPCPGIITCCHTSCGLLVCLSTPLRFSWFRKPPCAPHWSALLWVVPALELLTTVTECTRI